MMSEVCVCDLFLWSIDARIGVSFENRIPAVFRAYEARGAFRNAVPNDERCLCVFDRFFRPIGARVVVLLIKKERWIVISVSQARSGGFYYSANNFLFPEVFLAFLLIGF